MAENSPRSPSPTSFSASARLLHADRLSRPEHGSVHKPLHTSATFAYGSAEELVAVFQGSQPGHVYARQGNPTTQAFEAQITLLEGGLSTCTFATGMAAIGATFLALLKAGDHLICSQHLFGNTASLLLTLEGFGVQISYVDATDIGQVAAAVRPNTRMVFVESLANPRTQIAALEEIGALCAQRHLLFVLDNTMTTPLLLQGKRVGAGLVVHSLTKGISGHGNAMGGSVTDTGVFDWAQYPHIQEAYKKGPANSWGLLQIRKKGLRDFGGTLRAEDAHRLAVGAETMRLRIPEACGNALQLARWLQAQPQITRVEYPGLKSHPQHERAKHLFQYNGTPLFGTLMCFELAPAIDPLAFLNRLQMVIVSSHLSDTRTLSIPVALTIFWEMGAQRRQQMGIADGLIRLSVGIEPIGDLLADFTQALQA